MNNKKKITALIIGIMLASLTIATAPPAIAETPVTVWGLVYVNDAITDPDQVSLTFPGESPFLADLLGSGAYRINFDADGLIGETGTFDVVVSGQTWTADETIDIISMKYDYPINLTVNTSGPPNFSNPSPTGTGVSIGTSSISITIQDPDGDSFDWYITTLPDIGSSNSSGDTNGAKTCSISGLAYSTTYIWSVNATDGTGWRNISYSFTTVSAPAPPGPNPPPPNPPPTNQIPTADANGPYSGFIDEEITFDGSGSSDSDGTIANYTWDFGDTATGYGVSPTHAYDTPGEYTVILTVTDDDGATDTDETIAEISQPNIPPTDPVVDGDNPQEGKINTTYNFTAVSTDEDNDTIQYTFDWGDESDIETTDFVPNGTQVTLTHTWIVAGNYTITVTAFDNETQSGTTEYLVSIEEEKEPCEPAPEEDYTWLILLIIIIIILLITFLLLIKRKKPEEKKQPPKKTGKK